MYCNQNMRTVFFSQATTAVPPSSNCPTHQINIESARISTTNIMLALVFISSNHRWYPMLVSKLTWTWKNSLHSFQNHQITVSTRFAPRKMPETHLVAQEASLDVFGSRLPMRWWQAAIHRLAELTGDDAVPVEENPLSVKWRLLGAGTSSTRVGWLCFCVFLDGAKWIS